MQGGFLTGKEQKRAERKQREGLVGASVDAAGFGEINLDNIHAVEKQRQKQAVPGAQALEKILLFKKEFAQRKIKHAAENIQRKADQIQGFADGLRHKTGIDRGQNAHRL